MPTWFTIRVSKHGHLGRPPQPDIVVAMCAESFQDDVALLPPGGMLISDDSIRQDVERDDIYHYPLPVRKLVRGEDVPRSLTTYVANMVYVGGLAYLLDMDLEKIHQALDFHFGGKEKPVNLNYQMVESTVAYCRENLEKQDPFRVEPMDATDGLKLINGNEAAALGAAFGGVQFAAWYPITPATGIAEMLNYHLPKLRQDPVTGKNTFAVVQAEDELAAAGMVVGAGWGGLRAMTSTSGPGLSLMTEFASLAYFSETPIVVWDVQRVGPSTGLPTRTSQGDVLLAHHLGHGDTQNIVLLPGNTNECFQFGWQSFDLAEHLQTPVYVLSDLDLGVNQWMTEPFEYPNRDMDRGKVLWEEDMENWEGEWGRYLDVDGDGIPYRTLPGNQHPESAWFARGTGHDPFARYSEDPEDWRENMERLARKFESARGLVPEPVVDQVEGAEVGIIAYGSSDPAVEEARYLLQKEDLDISYLRLRAIPFSDPVREFIEAHDRVYVVEMNRDGQVRQLLTLDYPGQALKLTSVARLDGLPLSAVWLAEQIRKAEDH
jgi:2-oxoglutarate ferredoxin oxidoreductase subunit alpha